jgi:hypothetical protein
LDANYVRKTRLATHSGNKNMTDSTSGKTSLLAAHSGKKHDWHRIVGKKT